MGGRYFFSALAIARRHSDVARADSVRHRFELITREISQEAPKFRGRVFRKREQLVKLHAIGVKDRVEERFGFGMAAPRITHDAIEDAFGELRVLLVPEHEMGKRELAVAHGYVGNERHALHKNRLRVLAADDDSGILKCERQTERGILR